MGYSHCLLSALLKTPSRWEKKTYLVAFTSWNCTLFVKSYRVKLLLGVSVRRLCPESEVSDYHKAIEGVDSFELLVLRSSCAAR